MKKALDKTDNRTLREKLLDLFFPPRCPFCDEVIFSGADPVCGRCKKKLRFVTEPFCMKCGKPLQSGEAEYCDDCGKLYPTLRFGKTCPYCGSGRTWLKQGQEFLIKEIECAARD